MKDFTRNDKQVRFEGTKTKPLQGECKVVGWCRHRGLKIQSKYVYWPEIEVHHALPKQFRCKGLAIMHRTFAWVFTNDAIHHYLFFPLCEPPLFASEPACG